MFARFSRLTITLALLLLVPVVARAHCDSLDGPVVQAAARALETSDVRRAFVWIAAVDEAEVQAAFDKTVAVRALGGTARELADRFFFETVVRLHRRSEGEPYTGLKPAGRDFGPLIPAADRAILEMSAEPLIKSLTQEVALGVREHLDAVLAARIFPGSSTEEGRRYVKAYINFIHFVEGLQAALEVQAEDHFVPPDHTSPDW
jgi:Family of unknown function (DUF6448)